jgi:SAM-dependent methyltransferase
MTTTSDPVALPDIQIPADEAMRVPELPRRPRLDLFIVSFVILFFELAAIRWFGSTVVFLTFFTNIVLLATFLGMSVGLLASGRRQSFIRWTLPLSCLTAALAMLSYYLYSRHWNLLTVTIGNQQTSPQLIYFGTEYRPKDPSRLMIPLWVVAGIFFTLISIIFIGLGQRMGRAFDAIPNRVWAYTIDVFGSLSGIAAFGAMSYLQLPPHVWFAPIILLLLYLAGRWNVMQIASAVVLALLVAVSGLGLIEHSSGQNPPRVYWSPYYKVTYEPERRNAEGSGGSIDTNNIAHQEMLPIAEAGPAYALPHLLNRDAGGDPFANVMIIGAGSGNDVAAALRFGADHIDAVEIDPVINRIGRENHPDRPYDSDRVDIHLDDGRSFARRTNRKYDLAIYALVDSLVLHSGYSSIRLENVLFTKQAFEDVKKTLKPGGVFAMYNYYRQGWVVSRLAQIAEEVFGVKPIVISLPHQENILPSDNQANHITYLMVGTDAKRLEAIRQQFEKKNNFWINASPAENLNIDGFRTLPPSDDERAWLKAAPATVATRPPADLASLPEEERAAFAAIGLLPSDNWPQLYLREKKIPWAPTGQGIVTIAALSLVILLAFAPVRKVRPNGQMFFLGAGFMLLETKGVVHMALLFGSTWVVNSVVFFAILVMILFANLFVMAVKPRNLLPYYALLILALLVNALVPMNVFLSLEPTLRTVTSCLVVFVPVFFAGVIFASAFRDSRRPDVDFGSNVAGIILGGLSEQLSLVIGFNYLILVAIGYYLLSLFLKPRLDVPRVATAPTIA